MALALIESAPVDAPDESGYRHRDPASVRSRLLKWIAGIAGGLIVAVLGALLISLIVGEEEPRPRGAINAPQRVVPAGYVTSGRLFDIPDDEHVWLAARRGGTLWPIGREIRHRPSWERRIPAHLPRGKKLSLVLFMVGDDSNEALRSQTGRARRLPAGELGDLDGLDASRTFVVRVEPRARRLYSVFAQARHAGGQMFRYENAGGVVTAQFPDDPGCHRPNRPAGLRLRWRMSGQQSGGWGVAWDRSKSGRFDASPFGRLSFAVKGAAGGETFEIGLKDTAGIEDRVSSREMADKWRTLSIPLEEFESVDLRSLENLSIGFSQRHGSGEVCIDEITFAGTARRSGATREAREETRTGAETRGAPEIRPRQLTLEAEDMTGAGTAMSRGSASGDATIHLDSGESAALLFEIGARASYTAYARYSNDNYGPLEKVRVAIDGTTVGAFTAQDTGGGGYGWDRFVGTGALGSASIAPGGHRLSIVVSGGDPYGVEIDWVRLVPRA